jgi:excisionase family DNA binding protein
MPASVPTGAKVKLRKNMKETPNNLNEIAPPACRAPAAPSTPTSGKEGFISKRELARRLNKSLRTIQYWQRSGIIPYIKCGRSALFKWTDIEAHLQKNFRVCRIHGLQRAAKPVTNTNPLVTDSNRLVTGRRR